MTDVESFLTAIREEPDADTPRLVFADWLEEHDDPRGEFIRIQCELAHGVPDLSRRQQLQLREHELIDANSRAWLGSLRKMPDVHYRFDRGLIELHSNGKMLPVKWSPWIQTLNLRPAPDLTQPLSEILTKSRLKKLARLDVDGSGLNLETLSPLLLGQTEKFGVQHLRLSNTATIHEDHLPRLAGWPWPGFRTLDLDGTVLQWADGKSLQTEARWYLAARPTPPGESPMLLVNTIGMKLRSIPIGTFMMGSSEAEVGHDTDETLHRVTLTRPYYMGIYPVTQHQYQQVTGENPSRFSDTMAASDHHPVQMVTWDEANNFCKSLSNLPGEVAAGRSYRLPTEAEWEYACRAGTTSRFSFGNDWSDARANLLHRNRHTLPVGSFQANPFGLYDMHGQVREWCNDWYRREYYRNSPEFDPTGPDDGESKVLRGGSWDVNAEQYARSAYRVYFRPDGRLVGIGFRVVMEMKG